MNDQHDLRADILLKESKLRRIIDYSKTFIQAGEGPVDYMEICRMMAEISEVRFVAFNTYDNTTDTFRTEALHASEKVKSILCSFFGFELEGHRWPMGPNGPSSRSPMSIRVVDDLHELSPDQLPRRITQRIQKLLKIRKVMVVRVFAQEDILGDFTVFIDDRSPDPDLDIIETFSSQIGLYLKKNATEQSLQENRQRMNKLTEVLRKSQEHYQLLVDSSYDIIYRLSPEGMITFLSKAWEVLLGIPAEECVGKPYWSFAHTEDLLMLAELKDRLLSGKERQSLTGYRLHNSKGEWLYFDTNVTPLKNPNGEIIGFAGTARDVTAQIKWQNQIEFWSFRDPLTGLYNRRYLEDAIHRLDTERNLPFSVATLDVDNLKAANDTYGHCVGDQLLIKIADQLKRTCRKDDILCRIGGDEFVILLPKTSEKSASEFLERIRNVTKGIRIDDVRVSVSIGAATKKEARQDIGALLNQADRNMYQEKSLHRRHR